MTNWITDGTFFVNIGQTGDSFFSFFLFSLSLFPFPRPLSLSSSLLGCSRFLFFFRPECLRFLSIIKSEARLCLGMPLVLPLPIWLANETTTIEISQNSSELLFPPPRWIYPNSCDRQNTCTSSTYRKYLSILYHTCTITKCKRIFAYQRISEMFAALYCINKIETVNCVLLHHVSRSTVICFIDHSTSSRRVEELKSRRIGKPSSEPRRIKVSFPRESRLNSSLLRIQIDVN